MALGKIDQDRQVVRDCQVQDEDLSVRFKEHEGFPEDESSSPPAAEDESSHSFLEQRRLHEKNEYPRRPLFEDSDDTSSSSDESLGYEIKITEAELRNIYKDLHLEWNNSLSPRATY
jgi:hypothetical protein